MPVTFEIKPASEADIPHIIRLIRGLADYEKAIDEAKATPELLKANLFSEKPYAHVLLAWPTEGENRDAIGIALYYFSFSTWTGSPSLYLEDLFVEPQVRSAGVGKSLFRELGRIATEKKCLRMDWAVLDWNTPSIDFYEKKIGATLRHEWKTVRLEASDFKNLEAL